MLMSGVRTQKSKAEQSENCPIKKKENFQPLACCVFMSEQSHWLNGVLEPAGAGASFQNDTIT